MNDLEILHWFSSIYLAASIIASILVNVLPPPSEISWKPWVVFFNTMQRLSVHRPQWNKGNSTEAKKNGNPTP